MATLRFIHAGRLSVTVHSPQRPTDGEWKAYVDSIQSLTDLSSMKVLVYSEGGEPSVMQRLSLVRAFKGSSLSVRTSLVTRSLVQRSFWFNPRLKTFPVRQFSDALNHLEADDAEKLALITMLVQLLAQMKMAVPAEILAARPAVAHRSSG